jgi:hypothetical protein
MTIFNPIFLHFYRISVLDIAELSSKAAKTVTTVRKVISVYKSLVSFYEKFSGGDNILIADNCVFTPENGYVLSTLSIQRFCTSCLPIIID